MNEGRKEDLAEDPARAGGKQSPGSAGWWRRLTQRMARSPRSREDLMGLLQAAREDQLLDADAADMIRGVFDTSQLQVRDIMIPRAQMAVLERDWPLDQLLRET